MPRTEAEILEAIDTKMESSLSQAKKANDNFETLQTKFNTEVERLNAEGLKNKETLDTIKEQVTELQAKTGRLVDTAQKEATNARIEIAKEFEKNILNVKQGKFKFDIEQKAVGNMTASANLTGSTVLTYNLQPAVRGRMGVQMRDLVPVIPSATGTWVFYRQNNPVGEGSIDFQTTHGAAKNQLDYDLTQVTVNAEFLAGYVRIARQMLQDLPFLQNFVNNELVEDYMRTETFKFFDQMATGGGATGSSTTAASVTVEKVIDYIANLMTNNYQPNAIIARPAVWASILKTKPADYSIPGGVTISPTGDVLILGIPLLPVTTNALSDSKVIVGDFSKAAIIQAEGLSVGMFEQDQDNVIKNLITMRIEARVGFAILRPDAFIYANS